MGEKFTVENYHETQIPRDFFRADQLAQWNDKNYHVEKYGNEFSVIIVGETHYNPEFEAKQIELTRLVRPEFVLHEFLGALIYNPITQKFEKQKGRIFGENDGPEELYLPRGLIQAANEMGFKIIGCDLTQRELTKCEKQLAKDFPAKYRFNEEFEAAEKIGDPNYIFTLQSDELTIQR